jgi:hypothetical protein
MSCQKTKMSRITEPRTERRNFSLTGVTSAGNQIKLPQIGIIQIRSYLRRPGVYRYLKQYC